MHARNPGSNALPMGPPIGPLWAGALACAISLLLSPTPPAHAEPAEAANPAMSAFGVAVHLYRKGEFERAAQMFLTAYSIEPKPGFLFNAARAEQRALLLDEAEKHFAQCLSLSGSSATIKRRARQHMGEVRATRATLAKMRAEERARLEKQLAARRTTKRGDLQGAAHIPDPAAEAPGGRGDAGARREVTAHGGDVEIHGERRGPRAGAQGWRTPTGWAGLGVGAALAGVGAWLYADYLGGQDALDGQTSQVDDAGRITGIARDAYRREQERLYGRRRLAMGAAALGAVAAGAGTWLLLSRGGPTLGLRPAGKTLTLSWRF